MPLILSFSAASTRDSKEIKVEKRWFVERLLIGQNRKSPKHFIITHSTLYS